MFNIVNLVTVICFLLSISLALSSQFIEGHDLILKFKTFWGEGQEKEDDYLQ